MDCSNTHVSSQGILRPIPGIW